MKKCLKCNKTYDDSWGVCLYCSQPLIIQNERQSNKTDINRAPLSLYQNSPADTAAYLIAQFGCTFFVLIFFMIIANMKDYPEFSERTLFTFIFYPVAIFNIYILAGLCYAAHKGKLFKIFAIAIFFLLTSIIIPLYGFDMFNKLKQWRFGQQIHPNLLFSIALIVMLSIYIVVYSFVDKIILVKSGSRRYLDKIIGIMLILTGIMISVPLFSRTIYKILSGQEVDSLGIGILICFLSVYLFPLIALGVYLLTHK